MSENSETESNQAAPGSKNHIWISGILISVLLGVAVAWMGSQGSVVVAGVPVFALLIGYAFALNWLAFIPSFLAHTEKYFDFTGAVTYISSTIIAIVVSGNLDTRAWIAGAVVIIWSARLGTFLFRRIHRDGKDGRFDTMKYDFWQFLMTWTLQGLWVALTAATAFAMITSETKVDFGVIGIIGFVTWLTGFAIEVVADQQKSKFRTVPANKGRFINTGLWAWSRHPNYFGEILLWTGVAIMAIPMLTGWRWFVLISPVFVYVLLVKVSGIPLLQQRGDERWGDDPEYQSYIKNTSLLIPLPPKS